MELMNKDNRALEMGGPLDVTSFLTPNPSRVVVETAASHENRSDYEKFDDEMQKKPIRILT
jgi:hypothetical protein